MEFVLRRHGRRRKLFRRKKIHREDELYLSEQPDRKNARGKAFASAAPSSGCFGREIAGGRDRRTGRGGGSSRQGGFFSPWAPPRASHCRSLAADGNYRA